jgi:hypothetical protein
LVALRLPGLDASLDSSDISKASFEGLAGENGPFDLGHVEPGAVLGGVMELELSSESARLFSRERLVERSWRVGIEVVEYDADHVGVGITAYELPHLSGEVRAGTTFADGDLPVAYNGFKRDKQRAVTFAFIFVVLALRCTWLSS